MSYGKNQRNVPGGDPKNLAPHRISTAFERYILTGNVELRDEKAALWSDCPLHPHRVDAIRTFLFDAALFKFSLPWATTASHQHPHTVAHVRVFVGCADSSHVVAGAAIPTRERSDSAACRDASFVWRARIPAAISCL